MSQTTTGHDEQQRQAPSYKDTLNLPRTAFPMKANLVQNEPATRQRWEKAGLYRALRDARAGAPRFVFHDGPPYANANIHLGHLLNKCMKDFVVRIKLMEGMDCPYVPGWDCHGLPIEHRVMQDLAAAGKLDKIAALPDDQRRMAVRRECAKHAEKFVKLQAGQMQSLLTLADYDDPYLTMRPAYEGATLEVFASLVEQGLVYRQLKAVHWSIANETALADAELEYYDRQDISVYVDFEAEDADKVYDAFGLPKQEEFTTESTEGTEEDGEGGSGGGRPAQRPCFMIWTTTPWTLPANLAIAVNKDIEYALVRVDGNITVIARELIAKVAGAARAEEVAVLASCKGEALLGLRYRNPVYQDDKGALGRPDFSRLPQEALRHAEPDDIYRVVGADYVTLEDGTGLVHTAPGHGSEDYQTGLRERLPVYCPVRENGAYDDSVPAWLRGRSVWDANKEVTEHLRRSGHLFFDLVFTHSYPHDWRGKTPVIFRATEQWFIGVDTPTHRDGRTLRELALDATAHAVRFVPEWGRNRMRGMLESRPDWCISRQRAWGLPIPAFYGPHNEVLLTPASVRAVAKRFRDAGSDAWFTETPEQLLRHYDPASDENAPRGLALSTLRKSTDIFDVWFESGSSWNSVMRERSGGRDYPIDLYLEGSDQHRGWFQLSLLPALGATGRAPFKKILTHGFIVDKDGKKMSKSLGNTLEVEDLVKEFGADVCRWWVASVNYEGDIRADKNFFAGAGEAYRKVRNTLRFMLSNLGDFVPSPPGKDRTSGEGMCMPFSGYQPAMLDAWALARFDELSTAVRAAYAEYDFRRATTLLFDYCNDTLSAVYLAAVKDRLYCDAPDAPRRRRTQSALWDIADGLCRLLAPILPHTSEEAYRALMGDAAPGVHLKTFAASCAVAADPAWSAALAARDAGLQALEGERKRPGGVDNPLDAELVLPDPDRVLERFDRGDLADLLGVSRVKTDPLLAPGDARVHDLRDQPRCDRSWKRDGTVRRRADGGLLCDRCAAALGLA
ncbi:MAG TPA: isoleucine--tRNA ligase [Phycisphaerales bacterium]|nr:isoleucine--tRNA ligase [Phycisphaerales bacterium]